MKTFPLVISSPDGDVFRDNVTKISLRGTNGELAILSGHIPFITPVVPCECKIEIDEANIRTGYTDGGILTVSEDATTLLSGRFNWK